MAVLLKLPPSESLSSDTRGSHTLNGCLPCTGSTSLTTCISLPRNKAASHADWTVKGWCTTGLEVAAEMRVNVKFSSSLLPCNVYNVPRGIVCSATGMGCIVVASSPSSVRRPKRHIAASGRQEHACYGGLSEYLLFDVVQTGLRYVLVATWTCGGGSFHTGGHQAHISEAGIRDVFRCDRP